MQSIAMPEIRHTARIVISGNQGMIRAAIRRLLESEEGMTVVGECDNHPKALAEALRDEPDLILLDLDLSTGCDGVLERIAALLQAAKGTPVLILTANDECHAAQFALARGAIGFVKKDRPPDVLYRAISACVAGETWIERSTMAAMLRSFAAVASKNGPNVTHLTSREREIMDLVVLGLHNKIIAQRLCISDTTVRHHLTSIFDKLDVSNRLELMRYVLKEATSLMPPCALASR